MGCGKQMTKLKSQNDSNCFVFILHGLLDNLVIWQHFLQGNWGRTGVVVGAYMHYSNLSTR